MGVRAKVNEAEVEDKLDNLERGQVLLPPDPDSGSRTHIVVHLDVDCQVESVGHLGDRRVFFELDKVENHRHRVVEVVQELYANEYREEEDTLVVASC